MIFIKSAMLFCVFIIASSIGVLFSKQYINRVKELKEMKNALNLFQTKVRFTAEPIPETFKEISRQLNNNIGQIFQIACDEMQYKSAGEAWKEAVESVTTSLREEDKKVIKELAKLLGQTDEQGQLSQIALVNDFLQNQIENANQERAKNEKLYKTLGITIGLALVIVLI